MFGLTAEQKLRMEARERERTAAAKLKKQQDAKERKRKREAEKARIAQYEAASAAATAESPPQPERDSPEVKAQKAVDAYLDAPPFFGSSNYEDHDVIVDMCKGPKHKLEVNKRARPWQYGTHDASAVARLIGTGLWHPVGIMPKDHALLIKCIGEREIAEAIATEKRIAEATNAGELHAKAEAERQAQEKAQREADLRRGREPDDEAHVLYLQQLLELPNVDGVDAFLEVSTRWPDLGPACGLSRAERVLRIVHIRADWDWQAVAPETPGVQVPRPKDEDQRREGVAVLEELRKRQFATP